MVWEEEKDDEKERRESIMEERDRKRGEQWELTRQQTRGKEKDEKRERCQKVTMKEQVPAIRSTHPSSLSPPHRKPTSYPTLRSLVLHSELLLHIPGDYLGKKRSCDENEDELALSWSWLMRYDG